MTHTRSNKTKTKNRKKNYKTRSRRFTQTKSKTPKWVTALAAAKKSLRSTGSVKKARETLRRQALINAKKLFGAH